MQGEYSQHSTFLPIYCEEIIDFAPAVALRNIRTFFYSHCNFHLLYFSSCSNQLMVAASTGTMTYILPKKSVVIILSTSSRTTSVTPIRHVLFLAVSPSSTAKVDSTKLGCRCSLIQARTSSSVIPRNGDSNGCIGFREPWVTESRSSVSKIQRQSPGTPLSSIIMAHKPFLASSMSSSRI